MKYSGKTHVGMKRKNNQDAYSVVSRDSFFSAVVCDGMGGARGGGTASSIASKTYTSVIKKGMQLLVKNDGDISEIKLDDLKFLVINAIEKANSAVFEAADYDVELEDMGTTLVSVLICGENAVAANVGDSRMYVYKLDGTLEQVTRDHSFVQYLLDKGAITEEEARTHPNRNIILKAIGISEIVEPELFVLDECERVLLCTDGLTNMVDDEQIRIVLRGQPGKNTTLRRRVETLVDMANKKGGLDNITAVYASAET